MTNTDNDAIRQQPDSKTQAGRLRIDTERAAELVRRVKGARDEPFGPLSLVRAVIRREEPTPGR